MSRRFCTEPHARKGAGQHLRAYDAVVQYAGRLHRVHPGKTEVRIYDYVDRAVPMLARMFDKRTRDKEPIGERSVVDDEGELGTFGGLPLSGE